MASISGASSTNYTSSLYNSANVISGLASGLDTEGMIESLVKSYQNKIQTLSNKSTKLEWKQEAYRGIISKMTAFSNKYTSYTSSTNLMSSSFFNNAINVTPQGENAKKVSASGRTDSDVRLNSVSKLATAARYVTKTGLKGTSEDFSIEAGEGLDLNSDITLGTMNGSLSLVYGSKTVSISFDEVNDQIKGTYDKSKTQALADLITKKLGDEQITLSNGDTVSAADRIAVKVGNDGTISFSDKSSAGNSVYISGASDSVKQVLGLGDLSNAKEDKVSSFRVSENTQFTKEVNAGAYLSGKAMNISLDGTTKSITLPVIVKKDDGSYKIKTGEDEEQELNAENYTNALNASLKKAFGEKVSVTNLDESGKTLQLKFNAPANSDLLINSDAGDTLGIGKIATNYLNTSKTLGELMGEGALDGLEPVKDKDGKPVQDAAGNNLYEFKMNDVVIGRYSKDSKLSEIMSDINANSEAGVKVNYSKTTREFVFTSKETGSENNIKLGGGLAGALFGNGIDVEEFSKKGMKDFLGADAKIQGEKFSIQVGDKTVEHTFTGTGPSMKNLLDAVNTKLKGEGMKASYGKDGSLVVTDKDGKQVDVTYNEGIAKELFDKVADYSKENNMGDGYTPGEDARFSVTVNGTTKEMTRGSNKVDIDGMTLTFKDTFEDGEPVTFERSTDSDKIVDAVKSMINDYNEMMSEIRKQYATLPAKNSSGSLKTYEPLSDEDKATMSESAIKNYEEKAKQGLLFGDSNLSNLYERMRNAFTPGGADSSLLSKIGITMGYDSTDGSSYVSLDESKLRQALENDPDQVAELFTKSKSGGAATDGIMQTMKTQLDRYAGLTGSVKGILVQQAGTPLNSLSLLNNQWQDQIDNIGTQIEKWQDKLTSQVDRYTSMFSKLEQLIYQMNSQSSTLAGLMGG